MRHLFFCLGAIILIAIVANPNNFIYLIITSYLGSVLALFYFGIMIITSKTYTRYFLNLFIKFDNEEKIDIVAPKSYSKKNSWESNPNKTI
jgi:hypothetical protein